MMRSGHDVILRGLDALGSPENHLLTFMCMFGLLVLQMAPISWGANEINYFDLSLRFVAPEQFSPNSAVFDRSAARMLSFGVLGVLIELVGADAALILTRVAMAWCFALALTALALAWSMTAGEMVFGVVTFILLGQNYFAHESIFGSVEAKAFAYGAVLAAIACASSGREWSAIFWLALATYFHFLVGGFWAVAVLLLMALRGVPVRQVVRLFLIYSFIASPMLILLVYEQLAPFYSESVLYDVTLNQIYAVFRAPHHLAPFVSLWGFIGWIRGISEMLAAAFLVGGVLAAKPGKLRPVAAWLFALHIYLMLSLLVAYVDRNTHHLAFLYLFRPNALIMLLLLLMLVKWLRLCVVGFSRRSMAALAVAATMIYVGPKTARIAYDVAKASSLPVLVSFDDKDAHALLEWLRTHTEPEAVVVLEPTPLTDGQSRSWVAFERAIGRPTLISFKFVPTFREDLARWYRLIRWREAVFAGECTRVAEHPVDYLVTVQPRTRERVAGCGTVLWTRGAYAIVGNLRRGE